MEIPQLSKNLKTQPNLYDEHDWNLDFLPIIQFFFEVLGLYTFYQETLCSNFFPSKVKLA